MSPTGIIFSYALGLIFATGGVLFLVGLDENRLLFGLPYLIIGALIVGGVWSSQRRVARRAAAEAAAPDEDGEGAA